MLALVKSTIDASSQGDIIVKYDDVELDPTKDGNKNWLRVGLQHTAGSQATLTDPDAKRRFRMTGFISVECFFVKNDGLSTQYAFIDELLEGFQKANIPGIPLRNSRPFEVGGSGTWFLTNVFCDFEYDQIR